MPELLINTTRPHLHWDSDLYFPDFGVILLWASHNLASLIFLKSLGCRKLELLVSDIFFTLESSYIWKSLPHAFLALQ